MPVVALIAALKQAVADSGLFNEAHLAQWLGGQRTKDDLAREPQNRIVAEATRRAALGVDSTAAGERSSRSVVDSEFADVGELPNANATALTQPGTDASVHAATIPLIRQQLDLLATGQFRWSGQAWSGARLDWTIEEGNHQRERG